MTDQSFLPESENRNKSEEEQLHLERIAAGYFFNEIPDDNPSEEYNLTALDELILYAFDVPYDETLFETLVDLKNKVREKTCELFSEDVADACDEYEPKVIPCDFNEQKVLIKIVRGMFNGLITNRRRSFRTGMSSLEHIIEYQFGISDMKEQIKIKKKIKGMQIALNGGSLVNKQSDFKRYVKQDLDDILL